jgi:hypothetical protein
MSCLEPLPLFPCPALSLAHCFRGDDGGHSSSWSSYFGSLILGYYLVKVIKKNGNNVLTIGPFSSSLLPLLEATDTFGRVVTAVVVMVVVVNSRGGRPSGRHTMGVSPFSKLDVGIAMSSYSVSI